MAESKKISLIASEKSTESKKTLPTWKILIIDDDPSVYKSIKLTLFQFSFLKGQAELLYADSSESGLNMLKNNPDIALILLDVVMEKADSGLKLVQVIREELKNDLSRIILITGNPGQAPAEEIIVNYDVNDYQPKSELNDQRLFTTVVAALRNYNHLTALEDANQHLEKRVEEATQQIRVAYQRLAHLLEIAENTIVAIDHQHRVFFVNHKAEALFGVTSQSVFHQPITELFSLVIPSGDSFADWIEWASQQSDWVEVGVDGIYREGRQMVLNILVIVLPSESQDAYALILQETLSKDIGPPGSDELSCFQIAHF